MVLFLLGMISFIILLVYIVSTWAVQINEDSESGMQNKKEQKKDIEKSIYKEKKHA